MQLNHGAIHTSGGNRCNFLESIIGQASISVIDSELIFIS